jgi:hypothetical protein
MPNQETKSVLEVMKRLQEKPATKNNSKKQYPKGNSKIQVVEK